MIKSGDTEAEKLHKPLSLLEHLMGYDAIIQYIVLKELTRLAKLPRGKTALNLSKIRGKLLEMAFAPDTHKYLKKRAATIVESLGPPVAEEAPIIRVPKRFKFWSL